MSEFIRSQMLLGEDSIKILGKKRVAVFGIGGVGTYICEALARCGVGAITLIDNDVVSVSNINRQLVALHSTIGEYKTHVMRDRILDINPDCKVEVINEFYTPENKDLIDYTKYDYIVDAIDTVTSKLLILEEAKKADVLSISSMGTGNKLNPSLFVISDISKTHTCPLARVMRKELKTRGITKQKVLWSTEKPREVQIDSEVPQGRRQVPGSVSFVPSVAGLMISGEVIKDLLELN